MKLKSIRRTLAFVLVSAILFASSAFAVNDNTAQNEELEMQSVEQNVTRATGQADSGYVESGGDLYLYPTLNSYVGLQRTFMFWGSSTGSKTPEGNLVVWVYKPNGDLLDFFSVEADTDYVKTFTLPSSGYYTVHVHSTVNQRVYANALWTA